MLKKNGDFQKFLIAMQLINTALDGSIASNMMPVKQINKSLISSENNKPDATEHNKYVSFIN